jgi:hypothetical protein
MLFLDHRRCAFALLLLCAPIFAQSDSGSYDETSRLYRNRAYAFSCKVPAGWVLRTDKMNGVPDAEKSDSVKTDPATSQVLLAAFERPPEATGPTPASTILIATESQSTYPGLKNPEDYFGPLTEVVAAKGFKIINDPYPFKLGTTSLVRVDFSREDKDRVTMYQSTLVLLTHGTIVSFTFLAASEDEIEGLIENLSFSSTPKTAAKTAPKPKAK